MWQDLISSGLLGLKKAAESYDRSKGNFRGYSSIRVRGEMLDEVRAELKEKCFMGRYDNEKLKEINKKKEEMEQGRKTYVSEVEAARSLGEQYVKALDIYCGLRSGKKSTQREIENKGSKNKVILEDFIPCENIGADKEMENKELRLLMYVVADKLPEQDSMIFKLKNFEGKSINYISEVVGCSPGHASHLYKRAERLFKKKAMNTPLRDYIGKL